MVTRCVHHFCSECITKAIESSSGDCCQCPLCNHKITKRSLRRQLDVLDMIEAFKVAVRSFERDNEMSSITDNNDVVVFDVSSDRSKSCVQINDSFDSINEFKHKGLDKTNVSAIESSDIELNRKIIATAMSGEWPSCESSSESNAFIVDIKELDETDAYFESTNGSINENCYQSLDSMEPKVDSVVEPLPTQSQNLKVTKSRITYSSSRPPTDNRFDRIIRLSEIN